MHNNWSTFLEEHSDLNIKTKIHFYVQMHDFKFSFVADYRGFKKKLYEHVQKMIGNVDVLFLVCEGVALNWLYGPLLTKNLRWENDRSKKISGSDCQTELTLVDIFNQKEVYVYAMG